MILPCPICSSVIHGHTPRPIVTGPLWRYASNVSRKESKTMFIWDPVCEHGKGIVTESVPDAGRAEIEERWNAMAKKAFNVRTMPWTPDARKAFGMALGFIPKPEAEVKAEEDELELDRARHRCQFQGETAPAEEDEVREEEET